MRPVYIPADQIAEGAAHDHVGGEVLPGRDARQSNSRGRAVGQQFGQRSGIFLGDDARDRPCGQGMFRGKRGAAGSEAAGVRLVRTRSLESEFHSLAHDYAVHRRFTRQYAGLAAVVVVGGCSAQVQARGATNHGRESVVAKATAVGNGGASKMPHDVLIARHQAQGANSQGHEPVFILGMQGTQMQWTGPDGFLIRYKTLLQVRQAETGRHTFLFHSTSFSGSRTGWLRRRAAFSLADTLAGTLAGTGFQRFGIGCPAGVSRGTEEQSHGHRLAKMPPEFVEEKHAPEWPAGLGLLVGLAREVGRQEYAARVLRRRFQIVRIDLHRHALHDYVEREHNPKVVFLADQHAFHPRHRSSLDADPLADDEVGVGLNSPLSETGAERFDFKIGKRREDSSKTNQRHDTWHFEYAHALPGIDAHKHVIWKEWQLEIHPATVLPTVACCVQRQKRFDLALGKVRSHTFFMMRIGVGRKPVCRKFLGCGQPIHLLFPYLLSCCQAHLHDLRFHSREASLAPLSEVRLELSYFGVTAHVLYCTYPATTGALPGFVLVFLLVGVTGLLGDVFPAIPGAGT